MSFACSQPGGPVTIISGEKAVFTLKFRDVCNDPVDLTIYDKFTICFATDTSGSPLIITEAANANGSVVAISGNAVLGQLKVTLGPVDTAMLKVGAKQDIAVELDIVATPCPLRKNLKDLLVVESSICP